MSVALKDYLWLTFRLSLYVKHCIAFVETLRATALLATPVIDLSHLKCFEYLDTVFHPPPHQ